MKKLNIIFNESSLGLLMITMLITATVYVYTESHYVQMFGLGIGLVVLVFLIGFTITNILNAIIYLVKRLKNKASN